MKPLTFMLIAGEASGDLLAAELVSALKTELAAEPFPPKFFGAGGARMAAAGVELAFDLTQHSVIGLVEVLKKYGEFKRLFDQLVQLTCERQPDVIVCVDFSGFNRRFAAAVRRVTRSGPFQNWRPKIVQYVSPQVWASRPGRAYSLERDLDLLLSILPFEREWYARHTPRLRVEFVGHPIVERHEVQSPRSQVQSQVAYAEVLLLPGSREGELRRHLPVMLEAARTIRIARPETRFRLALPNEDLRPLADGADALLPGLQIQVGDLANALREATVAIASTGTVTLECALFGVPTVALYKTSWSTYQIGRRIITVDFLAMPNLLAGEAVFPEFIQRAATGENLARAALELLPAGPRRAAVQAKLAVVIASLGGPGATVRAARAVLGLCR